MNAQSSNDDPDDLYDLFEDGGEENEAFDSESLTSLDSSEAADPQTQLLEILDSQLNSLTLEAETILSHQPRSTQLTLAAQTKDLFKQYDQFGSMARLKVDIEKYLRLGDQNGKLQIEDDKDEKDSEYTVNGPGRTNRPAHYGEAFMLNYTEDDDKQKFDDKTAFINSRVNNPFHPDPNTDRHPLRIIDPDSISYVTTFGWDPIATKLVWPARLAWPKGLLSTVNKILSIVDYESRVRLFHHVTKYGPSPVFRVGIAQRVKSQYSNLFETAEENYLGLTPETRSFLREIYYKKQYLNVAEKRLVALACRIAEDSVAMFWEDMADSLQGYEAMRIFMAAREIEKNQEAARKQNAVRRARYEKRRQEVMGEHVSRFNELRNGTASQHTYASEMTRREEFLTSGGGFVDAEDSPLKNDAREKHRSLGVTTREAGSTRNAARSAADRQRFDPNFHRTSR